VKGILHPSTSTTLLLEAAEEKCLKPLLNEYLFSIILSAEVKARINGKTRKYIEVQVVVEVKKIRCSSKHRSENTWLIVLLQLRKILRD